MKLKSAVATILILLCISLPNYSNLTVSAAAGPTVTTTLTDDSVQYGSKKTFDVWARNASGAKCTATVKLNGTKVEPTWDDTEKTSYTLCFTEEGENTVTVSASSDGGRKTELTYRIVYKKAEIGEKIGSALWSVETFTIGCDYLIPPTEVPIYEGETAAEQLIELLHDNGLCGYHGGTPKSSFYLAYIADGNARGNTYNGYKKSGTPDLAKKLDISPNIPSMLSKHLEESMSYYDPEDYKKSGGGYLGEFAFTNGSGWMYSVNNVFPNVGFADCYLSDGDTVRVRFTLGYGADIGGFGSVGTVIPGTDKSPDGGYFEVADKDMLNRAIYKASVSGYMSRVNVKAAYLEALSVMRTLDASQAAVDSAEKALLQAVLSPSVETAESTPDVGGAVYEEDNENGNAESNVSDIFSASHDSSQTVNTETEVSDGKNTVLTDETAEKTAEKNNCYVAVIIAAVVTVIAVAAVVLFAVRKRRSDDIG